MPDNRSTSAPARLSLGRYLLISEVSRGTFGRLWTACSRQDTGEAEAVLLRRLPKKPPFDEAALDAIRSAAAITTGILAEGVAEVLGVEETEDELAVVFQYANGKDLRSLLGLAALKRMPMPPGVAVHVMQSVLDGLSELELAGSRELAAGTIGPDSVLVTEDGSTRLLDAGIAPVIARTPGNGQFLQLIPYSAPEEFGEPPEFARCDVFRAGVLLWEMLSGSRLFSGPSVKAARSQLEKAPIPMLGVVDAALAEVVTRALKRDPEERFASAEELARALASTDTLRATDEDVSVWTQEIVGVSLASQQRATKRALARVARNDEDTVPAAPEAARPRPPVAFQEATEQMAFPLPPEAIPPGHAEATRQVDLPLPPEAFPPATGLRARTHTLLGVPEPGVLPAERPEPLPAAPVPFDEETTVAVAEEADLVPDDPTLDDDSVVTELDDANALPPLPPPPELVNASITELLAPSGTGSPIQSMDSISGLLELSRAGDEPPPVHSGSISGLLELSRAEERVAAADAAPPGRDFAEDATEVTPFAEPLTEAKPAEPVRSRNTKRLWLALAVVVGTLLPGALALAWWKMRGPSAKTVDSASSAAATLEPDLAGSASSNAIDPSPSASAAPSASASANPLSAEERAKQYRAWKKAHPGKKKLHKTTKKHTKPKKTTTKLKH